MRTGRYRLMAVLTLALVGAGTLRAGPPVDGGQDAAQEPEVRPAPSSRDRVLAEVFRPVTARVRVSVLRLLSEPEPGYAVAIDAEGRLLTNDRILGDATVVTVEDGEGRRHEARVVGREGILDVALLRLDEGLPAGMRPVPLADSADRPPGSWGVACGTGEEPIACGIIALAERKVTAQRRIAHLGPHGLFGAGNQSPLRRYRQVIQYDGTVPRGAFGAPLVDREGRLMGINVATFYRGSTYATPIEAIVEVLPSLGEGKVVPPPRSYDPGVEAGARRAAMDRLLEELLGEDSPIWDLFPEERPGKAGGDAAGGGVPEEAPAGPGDER